VAILPTNNSDLENAFTGSDYTKVLTEDGQFVAQTALDPEYAAFCFKDENINNTDQISITWKGQSDLAPSLSTVYLQIYNNNSSAWETLTSNGVASANINFTLSATKSTNLSYYYDIDKWVVCRVYQSS